MVIQHNIPALNSHRNLGINNSATAKNLEKLSSGYRINRAGDDAAGLAISEKMRGQIRGLGMAEQNASHGINLIQTAEGGLNETHSILQRMRELAVQSSNATYQDEDRAQIEKEFQALKGEIDRIATSTHYNGIKVLDGTTGGVQMKHGMNTGIALAGVTDAARMVELGFATGTDTLAVVYTGFTQASTAGQGGVQGNNAAIVDADLDALFGASGIDKTTDGFTIAGTAAGVVNKIEFTWTGTTWQAEITGGAGAGDYGVATLDADGKTFKFVSTAAPGTNDLTVTFDFELKTDPALVDAGSSFELDPAGTIIGTFGLNASTISYDFEIFSDEPAATDSLDVNFRWNGTAWDVANITSSNITNLDDYTMATTRNANDITVTLTDGAKIITLTLDTTNFTAPADGINNASFTISASQGTAGTIAGATNVTGFLTDPNAPALTASQTAAQRMMASMGLTAESALNLLAGSLDYNLQDAYLQVRQTSDATNADREMVLQIGSETFAARDNNDGTITFFREVPNPADDGVTKIAEDVAVLTNVNYNTLLGNTQPQASNGTISFNIRTDATGTGTALTLIRGSMIATQDVSSLQFQIGANGAADQRVGLFVANMSSMNIGLVDENFKTAFVYDQSVLTRELANEAIEVLNGAIVQVAGQRAELGALQNRLEHTLNNLGVTKENLTAAESTIRDVDMAKEMMEFTKNNILVQAAQAMLAQANQLPQGVLSLLR